MMVDSNWNEYLQSTFTNQFIWHGGGPSELDVQCQQQYTGVSNREGMLWMGFGKS